MDIQLRLIEYITRYAPSHVRVTRYLEKKKCHNITTLLEWVHYDESLMISLWMRTYITEWKSRRDIEMRLYKKEFPKELIQSTIASHSEELLDWESHRVSVEMQIKTLYTRGKSIRRIAVELGGKYPYFRDQISDILLHMDDTDALKKEVEKYKKKYNISINTERQKLYRALMGRGFSYGEIRDALADTMSE